MGMIQVMQSLLMAQPHKETVVGDGIATFGTDFKAPMKLVIPFEPVQEGTGDPSPDNVRPISGWTGCDITRTGKNLYDKNTTTITTKRTVNYTTGELNGLSNSRMGYTSYVPIQENTWYSISGIGPGAATNAGHAFYDKDKVYISGVSKGGSATSFETPAGAAFARFSVIAVTGTSAATLADEIQLELGQTATDFEAYNANALSVDWTDDAGTLYGGTVTLNEDGSVDLVSDVRFRTLVGTESWATEAETGTYSMKFKLNLSNMKYGSNITNALTNYIKRRESQAEGYKAGSLCIQFGWNDHRIFVLNATKDIADVSDLATWKAYLADHPLEIIYPLTTPTTYHFDNIGQLQSFLGTNNIWHNMNGDITVEYWNKQ